MGKILVVAEKPSVARDIARVLGVGGAGEGCVRGDPYVVTWAIGHLVAECDPDEIRPEWKKWRRDALPMLPDTLPLKALPKTKKQYEVVKSLLNDKSITRVICATDSGREGELIFRRIYQLAGCQKPVDRLWISSMTDAAIREGFARIRPDSDYDALYKSALCRSEADWLVGMNASRAFSLRYDARLSVGRVQTPTLMLLVKRDREIRAFVSRDYWETRANFGDYEGLWFDPAKNISQIDTEEAAKAIAARVKGKTGAVESVERNEKRTPPPQLYDLTALQREVNARCHFPAAKTLEIAQALYERHKLITYPRTDSRHLPLDMRPKVEAALSKIDGPLGPLAKAILEKGLPETKRVYDDAKISDHHAIVPTGAKPGALSDAERVVFDMIRARLVSAHMDDYRYESAKAVTRVGDDLFRSFGNVTLDVGWKAAEPDGGKDQTLPPLQKGDARKVVSASVKKGKTKPPDKLTDATLLYQMENAGKEIDDESLRESMRGSGLGTPATRAAVIERLIDVGYAKRSGKSLESTPKGEKLIDAAPAEIASPETTARWERALDRMSKASDADARAEKFMGSIRRYAAFLVEAADRAPEIAFEREPYKGRRAIPTTGIPCPICRKGKITENERAFGCSQWKSGCKFTLWKHTPDGGGEEMTLEKVKSLIAGQTIRHNGRSVILREGNLQIVKE